VTAATIESAPGGRAVEIFGNHYTVALPKLSDPRMHVAAVLLSVQVLGQTVLGFDLSIAQILLTLGLCAAIDIPMTMWEERRIAWPASALLTGNGIALLLRTPGTEHGDWWSLNGWPMFMAAAFIAVLSKYAIRLGRRHVFNPSNLGLVIVFLVFGAAYADPQELWWGPWRPGLVATVVLIVAGGVTLALRMRLFDVVVAFWSTFAVGIAAVALSGHAMVARWSLVPVEGLEYWTILITSPEIIIFAFFMITDPPTSPDSRSARLAYGVGIGALAALLSATQTTEFGTKVSLLAALTVLCAFRPALERLGRPHGVQDRLAPRRAALVGVSAVAWVVLLWVLPALVEPTLAKTPGAAVDVAAAGDRRPDVASAEVPEATVRHNVAREAAVDTDLADAIAQDTLADLAIADEALRTGDEELAATAVFGPALTELSGRIAANESRQLTESESWSPESAEVVLLRDPVSPQAIPQLGLVVTGSVTTGTHPGGDTARVSGGATSTRTRVFLVDRIGGHWLIGQVLEATDRMVLG
jgi:hypothetical protein